LIQFTKGGPHGPPKNHARIEAGHAQDMACLFFQTLNAFKLEPPKNSQTMELAGIRLAFTGRNHSRKASNHLASMNSGVPWGLAATTARPAA
jgi:hypothetical protein